MPSLTEIVFMCFVGSDAQPSPQAVGSVVQIWAHTSAPKLWTCDWSCTGLGRRMQRITGQGGRVEPGLTAEAWAAEINPGLVGICLQSFGCGPGPCTKSLDVGNTLKTKQRFQGKHWNKRWGNNGKHTFSRSKYTSLPQKALEVNHDAERVKRWSLWSFLSAFISKLFFFFILVFVHCAVPLKCNNFLSVVSLLELLQQIFLREALYWTVTAQAGDALCFLNPC